MISSSATTSPIRIGPAQTSHGGSGWLSSATSNITKAVIDSSATRATAAGHARRGLACAAVTCLPSGSRSTATIPAVKAANAAPTRPTVPSQRVPPQVMPGPTSLTSSAPSPTPTAAAASTTGSGSARQRHTNRTGRTPRSRSSVSSASRDSASSRPVGARARPANSTSGTVMAEDTSSDAISADSATHAVTRTATAPATWPIRAPRAPSARTNRVIG